MAHTTRLSLCGAFPTKPRRSPLCRLAKTSSVRALTAELEQSEVLISVSQSRPTRKILSPEIPSRNLFLMEDNEYD